jgi:protein gp37
VSFFFKQWGGRTPKANGRELEGMTWSQLPNSPRVTLRLNPPL